VAIVQAAMELFMARGYRAVTMDAVAKAAGVTKPAVYYHFKDKASILVAVARLVFSRARDGTTAILARPVPLRERLQAIARVVFALPHPFTVFDAMMHEVESELAPEQLAEIRAEERSLTALMERTILDAAAAGEIRTDDPVLAAHAFLALLRVGQARDPEGCRRFTDISATAERLVAIFWEGVGPGHSGGP
jgi:AcrR family transcriptional regulator